MAKNIRMKFKEGAASFYVVAFSTLVLVIIAASFAAIIISEMIRAANDDLSQSAYDSALAGIEDAKLAFYNYRSCLEQGVTAVQPNGDASLSCGEIIWLMEHPDCDMVARILGRIGELESGEVLIQETKEGDNSMQQAYTCVKINTKLTDYRSTLTEKNPTRIVKVKLANTPAKNIQKVKVSWYSRTDGTDLVYTNVNTGLMRVQFPTLREGKAATPPTLAVGLVQTAENFKLSDFDRVAGAAAATNRATVFLVPTDNSVMASGSYNWPDSYKGTYINGRNVLSREWVVKSNDRTVKNVPYVVFCPRNLEYDGFACSITIDLPDVIGGERSDETFMFVVSIPYGQPSTDFALEFLCAEGQCGRIIIDGEEVASDQAVLEGVQVNIDSTGRANNLYRRVEARLDSADTYFPYPMYAIELLDANSSGKLLNKNMQVTSEYSYGSYENALGNYGNFGNGNY